MKRFYTFFLIFLAFNIWIYVADAQDAAEWMPDANLRSAVRTALGLANDADLTQATMTNLTELISQNASIANLKGLEHATNLTKLDLRRNSISSIRALSGLTELTHLWLAFNSITDISSLSGLTNLTVLTLRDNSIGSITTLANLTNLTTLWIKNCGITDVSPLTGLTNLGTLRIAENALTNAHLLSDLTSLTDVDITIPDPPDTESPSVSISVPSGIQSGAFDVTITFTEAVSDFEQADVSLSGTASASITAWHTTDNTTYTATVTPTSSGSVEISIAADVATDAANNSNTASETQTVTVDVDAPGVSISVPSGVQNGPFSVTVTFTEHINLLQTPLELVSNTAGATISSGYTMGGNGTGTYITQQVTPTRSGEIVLRVPAGIATDTAGNPNTETSETQTVHVDMDAPSVSVSLPSGVQNSAFEAAITFTETVLGFEQADLGLSGTATATITVWNTTDATVYIAEITPTSNGTVILNIAANVAADVANNPNTAAVSQTVTIEIPPAIPDPSTWMPDANLRTAVRSALGLAARANFSQDDLQSLTSLRAVQSQVADLTGLEHATQLTTLTAWGNQISDVSPLENLTSLTDLRLGGSQISDVSPLEGLTSLTHLGLQRNSITDVTSLATLVNLTWLRLDGNSITDLSPLVTLVNVTDSDIDLPEPDTTAPGVSISAPSDAQNGAFDVIITFSEAVSDFVQADVNLAGTATATITAWSANVENTVYTATITPTASGSVEISVAANVATDAANNNNTAADTQTVTVDVDAPRASIIVPSRVQNGAFNVTIIFLETVSGSETVSGFAQSDVSLTGSVASITAWSANGDNTIYTATITPTASGSVGISVAANVATDAANNSNTAADTQTVTVDVDAPTVSIIVPSRVQNGAFDATITFTEAVSDFVQADVSLSGTATATITAWSTTANTAYTATITPTTSGSVEISIAANVATDAANNNNTAADTQTVTVDVDAPTATIGVPSGTQTGAFDATITFSETVWGFAQSDVSLSGSAASITAWETTDDTTYIATITPTASGTVTIGVAANVATDAANNSNTAATSQTVTVTVSVDTTAPSVSISVPSGVQNGAFNATITFTEAVSGFVQSDLSLTGTATATITAWNTTDDTVYTAMITPTASGIVTISVDANVATDAANNLNTVSATYTVTVVILVDTTPPNVSITLSTVQTPPNTNPGPLGETPGMPNGKFSVTITFTEPVEGFEMTDLVLTTTGLSATDPITFDNGQQFEYPIVSITGWTPSPDKTTYTAHIDARTSTGDGQVILDVPAGVASDGAGNPNIASEQLSVEVSGPRDITRIWGYSPVGEVYDGSVNHLSGICHIISTSGRDLRDFLDVNQDDSIDEDDVALVRAALGQFGEGIVNSRTDINCDNTVNEDDLALVNDTEGPTVSIDVPTDTQTGDFGISIRSNEIIYDFDEEDISLEGSTATVTLEYRTSITSPNGTHSKFVWITPTTSGDVVISLPAGVVTDALGNKNTASDTQTVKVDLGVPTVSISFTGIQEKELDPSSLLVEFSSYEAVGPFNAIITFSEVVSGFDQTDVSLTLTDGATATITAWNTTDNITYTATITPTVNGGLYISIPAGVATNTDNKSNTASDEHAIHVNLPEDGGDAPSITLSRVMELLDITSLESLNPDVLEAQLQILIAENDGSLKYLQAIALVKNALAALHPDETLLLANYPNPFNPETWIPYHLANPSNVQITIYDMRGTVVRRLDLGHQREGYYTNRSRAAYWDGRNDVGERVASGIYFYQFQADNLSLLRKMLILK